LKRARSLATRRRVRNVIWKRGELDKLPLRDASVDVALLSQALHHAPDPARALSEAARIVVPGGRVLVLDLRQHDENWVKDRLGDRWLGFADEALTKLLKGAGLTDVRVGVGARRTGDPFTVIVASAVKPGSKREKPAKS
jgi:ArsR family transcriptional regulator